jgi:GRIP domain
LQSSALLGYAQNESEIREQQTALLKSELRDVQAKLLAAEKLQNGAPFSYMRTIVARYLETGDPTLLPVVCDLLSFSDDESRRVRAARTGISKAGSNQVSYFSKMPFLGGS